MNVSRRQFLSAIGAGGAAVALPGCICSSGRSLQARLALQLYSIHAYIGGRKDKDGKETVPAAGLAKALDDVAAIGYTGVEFAGYYGNDAIALRKMLADSGLVACGTHVGNGEFGFNTAEWSFNPDVMKATCDFNLAYGNNLIICPGGGNIPPGAKWSTGQGGETCQPTKEIDEFTKRLVELYNKGAEVAAKYGCRIGLHNHTWEHGIKMTDGTSFWDYFFSNTSQNVCMEQDVGWSTCAGVDPKEQFRKYPHRSPTIHAKENGMGKDVKEFDAILGQPGRPGAVPVDWDGLIVATEADGVKWYVVECERHFEDLSAVLPSYQFLRNKGFR
ncbi:MAG: sugar phosphate isomerase/epimerase [Kiritimatiellae bacterium]|nr:sugar phosphate isomerase/epimerase [Kiritimatiellia bacterium]